MLCVGVGVALGGGRGGGQGFYLCRSSRGLQNTPHQHWVCLCVPTHVRSRLCVDIPLCVCQLKTERGSKRRERRPAVS